MAFRLVYFSTNKLVNGSNIAGDLKRILATAIANNTDAGVTGGLVHGVIGNNRRGVADAARVRGAH